MAVNKELPREPTVPPRGGFVGTFLLAGCLMSHPSEHTTRDKKPLPIFRANVQLFQANTEQMLFTPDEDRLVNDRQ